MSTEQHRTELAKALEAKRDHTEVTLRWKDTGETVIRLDTEAVVELDPNPTELVDWVLERYGDLVSVALVEQFM